MRILLALTVSSLCLTQIARADTDYEWQAKAAAAAINLRYAQPQLVSEINPAPWVLSPGVNKQLPTMIAPAPQPQARAVPVYRVVTFPFVGPATGPVQGLTDPNCPDGS